MRPDQAKWGSQKNEHESEDWKARNQIKCEKCGEVGHWQTPICPECWRKMEESER